MHVFKSDSLESRFWYNEIKMMHVTKVSICIQIKGKIYCKKIRDTLVQRRWNRYADFDAKDRSRDILLMLTCCSIVDRLLKENLIFSDILMIRYFDNELIFCMNTCIFISLFALNRKLSFVTITVWGKK